MKCLVSGATGFIGRQLCRQLLDRQVPFVALSRSGGALPNGTPTVALDLGKQEPTAELLQGVDVVFHLAGIAHQQAHQNVYTRVNHLATVTLAKRAAAAGVKCFVYLSSVKAMGPPTGHEPRGEESVGTPGNAYGLSKLRAEQDLKSACVGSDMSIVVLRPALVYGAQVKGNLRSMRKAVRAGIPRPPDMGGRSMIAVQDLVALMLQLADKPPPGFHTWIVCDGHRYSARKIYESMRTADGKGSGLSWLPLWAWRLTAYLADGLRDTGTGSTFSKLFGTELYTSAALLQAIAWQPQLQFSDVVGEIMAEPGKIKE